MKKKIKRFFWRISYVLKTNKGTTSLRYMWNVSGVLYYSANLDRYVTIPE